MHIMDKISQMVQYHKCLCHFIRQLSAMLDSDWPIAEFCARLFLDDDAELYNFLISQFPT